MSEHIKFEIKKKVATIRLDRPEKLNAFTDGMLNAWIDALEECRASDSVNVVVITGTGRAFSTGGDVGGFIEKASDTPVHIQRRLTEGIQRLPLKLEEIDKPVIAALNGVATGGGLDVALMCDIRFACKSAKFAETYVKLGLIPGLGGAYFLPRIIGTSKALEMLIGADFIDAPTAERIGLVNRVFPDNELMSRTYEFADRVAKGPPLAIRLIKRVLRQGLSTDLRTSLDVVAANMPLVRASADHMEALKALKEKRDPEFTGR